MLKHPPSLQFLVIILVLQMSQAFVKLPLTERREDILTRMSVLHDKLVQARLALSANKKKRKAKRLNLQDKTVSIQVNSSAIRPTYSTAATETKSDERVLTTCSQNFNYQISSSLISQSPKNRPSIEGRGMVSEPIPEDKQNNNSPIKYKISFGSPNRKQQNESKMNTNKSDSPVRLLTRKLASYTDENLLQDSQEDEEDNVFQPLQIVSQNSLSVAPRESLSNNKKQSTNSILSGSKQRSAQARFKLSNKYLDLSGCQWQSAYAEQGEANDFEATPSDFQFKEISFIPSIFQKKTIHPKKKKTNRTCIQISGGVRNKVANMIKQRLRYNQQQRERQASKKEKNPKQSYTSFLQSADLQKKLKQTLVKKVVALHDPRQSK